MDSLRVASRRWIPAAVLSGVVAGAMILTPTRAGAQCYQTSGYTYDNCGSSNQTQYEWYPALSNYFLSVPGHNQLLLGLNNDLRIYELGSNPLSPQLLASPHIPWDWTTIDVGGSTHEQYIQHLRHIAVLPGYPYALVSLATYGWDLLQLGSSPHFLGHGYHPTNVLPYSYVSSVLYQVGGNTYVIGQELDQASVAASDTSMRIYTIDNGGTINPATVGYSTMGQGVRIPVGGASDPPGFTNAEVTLSPVGAWRFQLEEVGGRQLLFARRNSGQYVLLVIDVTDATNPIPEQLYTNADLPGLFKSNWVANTSSDGTTSLWVADNQTMSIHRYNVTVGGPLNLPAVTDAGSTCWSNTTPCAATNVGFVGAVGDLITVGAEKTIGYLTLTGGTPELLPPQDGFTTLVRPACAVPQYSENIIAMGALAPFEVGGEYYVGRSMFVDADVISVAAGCMSTVPVPNFSVTGGAASATCNMTAADNGFPGDTFSITDTSMGQYTTANLTLVNPSNQQVFSIPIAPHATTPWTAQANLPGGTYSATLAVVGGSPPSVTKTIEVCNNPRASLALTPGSQVLVNEPVTLSAAASAGSPSAYRFWVTEGTTSRELTGTGSSRTYIATAAGTYPLGVVAQYLFPATNDTACNSVPLQSLLAPNVYNSCATQSVTAGYGVSSFEVWQNGVKIADSTNLQGNPGMLLVDQLTTLKFTGELASGYTPYFAWNIPGATPGNCTYINAPSYTGSTCTIPAGTWTPQAAFAMNMTLHVCQNGTPGTDCGATISVPAPAVWVQPSLNTFTFTATPSSVNIGAPVAITLTAVTGTFTSLSFDFGGTACDGTTQKSVNCIDPFGNNLCSPAGLPKQLFSYSYQSSGPHTVTGTGIVGGVQVGATGSPTVTVSTQGACTCPAVTASISGPSAATVGQPVSFTASASAGGYTITSYSWTFGDGGSANGQTVSHTYTSVGTRTVQVTATSSCGSRGTASKAVYVSGGGGGTLTITPSPQTTYPGTPITFTFSPAVHTPGDSLTFTYGDGQSQTFGYISFCQNVPCNTVTHTYSQPGTFTVNGSGVAGGASVSGSTSVTINSNCTLPYAPAASFTFSPEDPSPGQTIQFTDTSTGTPTSWSWRFGDGTPVTGGGSSSLQNPTYSYSAEKAYTVTLTASNCKGSSTASQTITVMSCTATVVPTADFDWSPKDTITVGGVSQDQPYAGENVTLTDASTNQPISWHWDFGDGTTADVTTPTATHAWVHPGAYPVTVTATNCIGPSEPVSKTITIASDVRPVTADFNWDPLQPAVGSAATFTASQGASYGDPTSFTWVFSDDPSNPATGVSVSHTFTCGGAVQVTLTAGREGITGTTPKIVSVDGTPACGPQSVVSADAAKVQGLNGTYWRTDMRIFNASDQPSTVTLGALPVSRDNGEPFELPAFNLAPKSTLVVDDVIQEFIQAGADVQKAAILTRYPTGDPTPVVSSRTYTNSLSGGTYGQSVAGIQVWPNTTPSPLWITGVRNDGTASGFRTNFGLTNLRGDSSAAGIQVSIISPTGSDLASKTISLPPYGYLQDSVKNLFGSNLDSIGPFAIKVQLPAGVDVEPYGSLVDNLTGDPTLVDGEPVVQGGVYLVAVAHLPGENNTVWRTDAQFTNPDSVARTWNVKFTPRQFSASLTRPITLAASNSLTVEDLVGWVYQETGANPPDSVSGVIQVTAADGLANMPIVAARTYNLTDNGTFGHGVPALDPSKGATATGLFKHLFLTGMSSQDVSRSNLGFVNLGNGSVNFEVMLYDESGNMLNPNGTPLQVSLGPDGWDQDKLENRFKNTFGTDLPVNLRAVSAVITVVSGGPGYAYASVVDSVTGDPIFVGSQLSP
ncbi:MAG: PKD domain-containing protein [Acidobacteriota bacterium]